MQGVDKKISDNEVFYGNKRPYLILVSVFMALFFIGIFNVIFSDTLESRIDYIFNIVCLPISLISSIHFYRVYKSINTIKIDATSIEFSPPIVRLDVQDIESISLQKNAQRYWSLMNITLKNGFSKDIKRVFGCIKLNGHVIEVKLIGFDAFRIRDSLSSKIKGK